MARLSLCASTVLMVEPQVSDFVPPVRTGLEGVLPYGAPVIDVPVRVNVNENPYGPSPALVAALQESLGRAAVTLNRYPDRTPKLCEANWPPISGST